ncbi:MAG: methyltransferase domain-containing protein [Candidatus Amesbacteria bacterium]|nr:methyltransferase domain-containing protein [Candidatus Amesbacteria bacterium]
MSTQGWDPVADWYDGWVGDKGSIHHIKLAIPAVMELLAVKPGEKILDIGCGQGVLAQYIVSAQGLYTGIDVSEQLIKIAKNRKISQSNFLVGDARKLNLSGFDAGVMMLSIQDIDPLEDVIKAVTKAIKVGGRLVIFMNHPAFRIPRQSGWGWDEGRKLQYRRIDRYLTPLAVPMKAYSGGQGGVTTSFHRPLQNYVNILGNNGFVIDRMLEIPTYKTSQPGPNARAENLSFREIPQFLALRAICKK